MASPRIMINFGDDGIKFEVKLSTEPRPEEAHFELAGRELLALAQVLREARLSEQFPVTKVETSG